MIFCYNKAMTKLAIMSDLHVDLNNFGPFEIGQLKHFVQRQQIDHLHLAGDISNHFHTITQPLITELRKTVPITYNLGNHDMLDLDEKAIHAMDFKVYQIGKRPLLAFHGWYDYSFYPERTEAENLAFKNTLWFDRRLKRLASDPELTQMILQQLNYHLTKLDDPIISMHFVPHKNFTLTHPRFKPFNAFLGSQSFHDLFTKHHVRDVVFGHAHQSFGDQMIDGVTYHSHPLGYAREWDLTIDYVSQHPQYNPTNTWNLHKRYKAVKDLTDFQDYKMAYFQEELDHSVTFFEL